MSKLNIKAAIAKAAKTTNLNEARTSSGGNYTPPAKGVPGLRFVAYVETGTHTTTYSGKDKVAARVELVFELHGKKWPVSENGQPQRLTVKLTAPKSGQQPHVKSTYYKLFKAMNYEGKYNHFAEMLGNDYIGTVYHKQDAKDAEKVYAGFVDPDMGGVPTIRAPFVEDEEGEPRRRKVPEAINDLRLFLWDSPDMEQWRSIFVDGEYDDGRSKNKWQDAIRDSDEFDGSPAEAMLMGLGDTEDDDVDQAKADAKKRQSKKQPDPEPDDDDESGDDREEVPETKSVKGNTARSKTDKAKRGQSKKATPTPKPESDDEDDPMGDIGGDDDE